MEGIERNFSTGSVAAPDPYDKYLDSIGYYRKNIARDASCLFRVLSEQIYDAQVYHPDIREICVRYMQLNRSIYEKLVVTDLDFDEYLQKLSKSWTPGTLTELHALAYRYKRNVLLFDAYSSGKWYVSEPEFRSCLSVFYVPHKHFDSIYTKSYMESIAFAQSLTYEIIYSHVFKLPDVVYAVERMLHDASEDIYVSYIGLSPYDDRQESLTLSDGRYFILDDADETECVLENYLLCHFHNAQFDEITKQLEEDCVKLRDDPDACDQLDKWFGALLPRRNVSCVRQLLDEGITPFSYKVAKALDCHIYRNIEFDIWTDARKKSRLREWRQSILQVGVKCLVDNAHWDQKSSYTGYIQEVYPNKGICDVYIENLGSRTVKFSSITTLSKKTLMTSTDNYEKREVVTGEQYDIEKKNNFNLNKEKMEQAVHYFTKPIHIAQQYHEYIACPQYNYNRTTKNDDTAKGNNSSSNKNVTNKKNAAVTESKPAKVVELPKVEYESRRYARPQTHVATANSDWNAGNQYNYSNVQSNFGYARRTDEYNFQGNSIASMVKRRDLLPSMHQINVNVQESCDANGRDLPYNDIRTLRFFYNLGIDFLRFLREIFPAKTISSFFNSVDSLGQRGKYNYYNNSNDCADLAAEFQRNAQISSQDQYSKTPDVGQQHQRPYSGASTTAPPKKNTKSYRYEYKGKRPVAEDNTMYAPNYSKTSTDYAVTSSKVETNVSTQTDDETAAQYVQPLIAPVPLEQYYPCYPADISDSTNMYLYGYYPPVNENMVPYQMLPSGMALTESDECELAQTYPYYNQSETYYYTQPFQPMAMPTQGGIWYPQQLPLTIPTTMATPIPTTSFGQYTVPGTNDHSNNTIITTSVPNTPNEPSINTGVKRKSK